MLISTAQDLHNIQLSISRKSQKKRDYFNFFFNPQLDISLKNSKVFYIDPNSKFIVFIFSKVENINLFLFCKSISSNILFQTKSLAKRIMYNTVIDEKEAFPFYLVRENNEEFTIKCNMCSNIKFYFENNLEKFRIPRNGLVYDKVILNIKNIWEDTTRIGFNIDIKEVYIT